ncbi:MAG: division/cell wall cluster transcriptional repressor MraZ [Verrucomicrobiota bacterium]
MEITQNQAYTDTFEHAFDEKGRITVPKEWRGDGFEVRLHVMPSKEGCLKVYPGSYLARKQAELAANGTTFNDPKRKAFERLASSIQALVVDQNNRMSIKEKFREHAGLKKKALLAGAFDHFEVWSPEKWQERAGESFLEDIAEEVGL